MARLSLALILTAGGLVFASPAQAQTAYAAGYAAPYDTLLGVL